MSTVGYASDLCADLNSSLLALPSRNDTCIDSLFTLNFSRCLLSRINRFMAIKSREDETVQYYLAHKS